MAWKRKPYLAWLIKKANMWRRHAIGRFSIGRYGGKYHVLAEGKGEINVNLVTTEQPSIANPQGSLIDRETVIGRTIGHKYEETYYSDVEKSKDETESQEIGSGAARTKIGRLEFPNLETSGTSATDKGTIIEPTYPIKSFADWGAGKPYVFTSPGGSSIPDPLQFTEKTSENPTPEERNVGVASAEGTATEYHPNVTIALSVTFDKMPPPGGVVLFSIGEGLKIRAKPFLKTNNNALVERIQERFGLIDEDSYLPYNQNAEFPNYRIQLDGELLTQTVYSKLELIEHRYYTEKKYTYIDKGPTTKRWKSNIFAPIQIGKTYWFFIDFTYGRTGKYIRVQRYYNWHDFDFTSVNDMMDESYRYSHGPYHAHKIWQNVSYNYVDVIYWDHDEAWPGNIKGALYPYDGSLYAPEFMDIDDTILFGFENPPTEIDGYKHWEVWSKLLKNYNEPIWTGNKWDGSVPDTNSVFSIDRIVCIPGNFVDAMLYVRENRSWTRDWLNDAYWRSDAPVNRAEGLIQKTKEDIGKKVLFDYDLKNGNGKYSDTKGKRPDCIGIDNTRKRVKYTQCSCMLAHNLTAEQFFYAASIKDGSDFSGIYIQPSIPVHRFKMLFVGSMCKEYPENIYTTPAKWTQAIMCAYSQDMEQWSWFPRAMPLAVFDDYHLGPRSWGDDKYPDNRGASIEHALTPYPIDTIGAIQTQDGNVFVYYDQRDYGSDLDQCYSQIKLYEIGRGDPAWSAAYHIETSTGTRTNRNEPLSLLKPSGLNTWDGSSVRFGSIHYDPKWQMYKLWFSGYSENTSEWSIGWTASRIASMFSSRLNRQSKPSIDKTIANYGLVPNYPEWIHYPIESSQEVVSSRSSTKHLLGYVGKNTTNNLSVGHLAFNDDPDQFIDDAKDSGDRDDDESWDLDTDTPPNGAADRIQGIHRQYSYESGEIFVWCGAQLYLGTDEEKSTEYLSGSFTEIWPADYTETKQTWGYRYSFAQFGDNFYTGNGVDRNLWFDGTRIYWASPSDPAESLNVTDTTAGGANVGDNYWFVHTALRQADGYETGPSPIVSYVVSVTDVGPELSLSSACREELHVTESGLDRWRVYGTTASGGPYALLTELVLATTTYDVNVDTNDWNYDTTPPDTYAVFPSAEITFYAGIPFWAGMTGLAYQEGVLYGYAESAKRYQGSDYFDFSSAGTGKIRKLIRCGDYLLAIGERAIVSIFGDHTGGFRWRLLSDKIGCQAPYSAVSIGGPVVFLGNDNVYLTSGGENDLIAIGTAIKERINEISKKHIDQCFGAYSDRKYYLFFPYRCNINNRCLIYDFDSKAWTERDNQYCSCIEVCNRSPDRNDLLAGDSRYGIVWNLEKGQSDAGTAIKCRAETGDIALSGMPEIDTRARKVYVDITGDSGLADVLILADRSYRSWIGSFGIPLISIVAAGGPSSIGGIIYFPITAMKSTRESSLSDDVVGRMHRVGIDIISDGGEVTVHGLTVMHRPERRR